jgi:hypothetical protein
MIDQPAGHPRNEAGKRLRILMVVPSHYDREGYLLHWRIPFAPLHVLAVMRGIMDDAADREVLGPGVKIETRSLNEVVADIRPEEQIAWLKDSDRALFMLVGIQTTKAPRAVDLGKTFIAAGIPTIAGGFHIGGCLSMVPDWEPGLGALKAAGISLFAGEFEETVDEVLTDFWNGELKPLYNQLNQIVDLEKAPMADIHTKHEARALQSVAGLEVGRGCPFTCSFCTIIHVHGRKMRQRDIGRLKDHLIELHGKGITELFVVDDNFARCPKWPEFFEALTDLRENRGIPFQVFLQVDIQSYRNPGFVEAATRAGVNRIFIGIESINATNLTGAAKPMNANLDNMAKSILTWKRAGVMIIGSYIVGFPDDTEESILQDMTVLRERLALDIFEVCKMTLMPGSEDHKQAVAKGIAINPDFNLYDSGHQTFSHPRMSSEEWDRVYKTAIDGFYTNAHMEKVFKRALVGGVSVKHVLTMAAVVKGSYTYHEMHPVMSGFLRRRRRLERCAPYPLQSPLRFHAGNILRGGRNMILYTWLYGRLTTALAKAWLSITLKGSYTDAALEPTATLPSQGGRAHPSTAEPQTKEAAE